MVKHYDPISLLNACPVSATGVCRMRGRERSCERTCPCVSVRGPCLKDTAPAVQELASVKGLVYFPRIIA